jgi:cell division protein FtsL
MPLILQQLVRWLLAPRPIAGSLLCGMLVVSSLGVAYSSHQTRNMYRDLQQLEKDHDDLEHEYQKLLLEQSAWSGSTRLNELAQDRLQMFAPETSEMIVLK